MALPPMNHDDVDAIRRRLATRALQRQHERGKRAAINLDGRSSTTPAVARAFIQRTAGIWQLPQPQTVDLVLIVSEMASNAIRHTNSHTVAVTAACMPGAAMVSVTDSGPHCPLAVTHADHQAEDHRGLSIIAALSEAWGHLQVGAGTRVWARVAVPLGAVPRSRPGRECKSNGGSDDHGREVT
ncbi:ATP-binding protein [Streptomyces sp. NPDC002764]|uniref:ATP-binding protein n=1 Tax=Streptomyces sp. NPDC002764 TaxID=3154428 RepID=UPI00332102A6